MTTVSATSSTRSLFRDERPVSASSSAGTIRYSGRRPSTMLAEPRIGVATGEHAANSPGLAGTADESATALASCSADIGDHRSSVVLIAPTMEIGIGGYLWLLLRDDLMRQKPYHNPQDEGEPIYRCERGR